MALDYVGGELGLFAHAANWKAYAARHLNPCISGRVLEVGAGIGANITQLANPNVTEWTALEPDQKLAAEITRKLQQGELPRICRVMTGTIDDVPSHEKFDTILYIDVLEHIADDRTEVLKAARSLARGGRLIILAPAHQFLYSPFDRAIGHFRRYNAAGLKALTPQGCRVTSVLMLDSAGFFASLANRLILRSEMPSKAQITTWDRAIVPLSRLLDPLTGFRFGKSVVIVWQAEA
jgi:SAM-dependent methyltransferase